MKHPLVKSLCAGLLLIVFLVPVANAGIGTSPGTHWSFKFDDRGIWHAQGDHVSFSWQLKPFELYDVMVDGTLIFGELSFPVAADAYMTEGATFKVMMGKTTLFHLNDNPAAEMGADCAQPTDPAYPPGPCDVAFPEGSAFEVYARGHTTQYHIEAGVQDNGIDPCWKVTTQGDASLDGSTIMFAGNLNLRGPVGLTMVAIEG